MTDKLAKIEVNFSIADLKVMAQDAVKAGLFPSMKTPEQVMTLMLICQSEGLHPIQALKRYNVIAGRAAINSDAMLGDFQDRGGKVKWVENSATVCTAEFTAPGLIDPVKVSWTMDDAKRAGLTEKDNWKHYPRAMLRSRVVSEGIRLAMPGIIVGVCTPEEVENFDRPEVSQARSVKAAQEAIYQDDPAPDPTIPDAEVMETESESQEPTPEAVTIPSRVYTSEEKFALETDVLKTIEKIVCTCGTEPHKPDCQSFVPTRIKVWWKAHGPGKARNEMTAEELIEFNEKITSLFLNPNVKEGTK